MTIAASDGQSSRLAWSVVGGPKYGRPVSTSLHAGPWTFIRWVIDRSRHTRSITRANRGRCSHTRTPGTAVVAGANSPRPASGASGFIAHRSIWLGTANRDRRSPHLV